jgi:hypothetical protein
LTASAGHGHAADGGTFAAKATGENGGIDGANGHGGMITIGEYFGDLACFSLVVGQQVAQQPLLESQHLPVEQQPLLFVVQQAL